MTADPDALGGLTPDEGRSVVGRVFTVLQAFESGEMSMSLTELSDRTGLAKGTLHRLCKQLVGESAIERTKYGYRLGFRLVELGTRVVPTTRLRELAMPFLQELSTATRGAAQVGILIDDEVYYVESVYSHDASSVGARPGQRAAAHLTASGLALLAHESEAALAAYGLAHRVPLEWLENETAGPRAGGMATVRRGGQPVAFGGAVLTATGEPICGLSVVTPPNCRLPRDTVAHLTVALGGLQARLSSLRPTRPLGRAV